MRNIKINPKFFFSKKKTDVMNTYSITEVEYLFIHGKGMPKDDNGCIPEEVEITIPDALNSVVPQTQNVKTGAPAVKSTTMQQMLSSYAPQPMCSQQQMNMQMAHDSMVQSQQWLNIATMRKQEPDCSPQEYAFYLQKYQEANEMAIYYYSMANNPTWNETSNVITTNLPNGTICTQTKAVNTPFSNIMMGLGVVGDSIATIQNAVDTLQKLNEIFGWFKGGKGNS